jgi:hypothetical protein
MKNFKIAFLLLVISIFFSACASSQSDGVSFGMYDADSNANTAVYANADTAASRTETSGGSAIKSADNAPAASQVSLDQADKSQPVPVAVERKIIRNADLHLEVNSPEESAGNITKIAESKGGFVIESQQQNSDTKTTKSNNVTMTVRVPADKFNETLEEIRKSGNRVINETIKGQDVTEEFIDIEARLKTKRALEEQFLEIMKRGNTVQDALNVQRELSNVRGEIEKIEGRKRFLENQTSFSTLKIRLQTPTAFSPSSSGFFYQISQAFSRGFDVALNFILILITLIIGLLPFLIFIVLPIYLLIRYFLRKSRKQKLASEIAQEEIKNG